MQAAYEPGIGADLGYALNSWTNWTLQEINTESVLHCNLIDAWTQYVALFPGLPHSSLLQAMVDSNTVNV